MMLLWLMMKGDASKDEIRNMQKKGAAYAQKNFIQGDDKMENVIQLSKPCTLCGNRNHIQLFAGLMLCPQCQENIRITNPGMFDVNENIEQKSLD